MSKSKSKKSSQKHETEIPAEKLSLQIRAIESELPELHKKLQEIEKRVEQFSSLEKFSPEKLRAELIEGIRLLGEKVSKAIEEINRRHEQFSEEIKDKIKDLQEFAGQTDKDPANLPLQESKLLDESDFEIVPKEAIEKLIELSKQQAISVKNIFQELSGKIKEL